MSSSSSPPRIPRSLRLRLAAGLYVGSVFWAGALLTLGPLLYWKLGWNSWLPAAGAFVVLILLLALAYAAGRPLGCMACGQPVLLRSGSPRHASSRKWLGISARIRTSWDILTKSHYHCQYCHTRFRNGRQGGKSSQPVLGGFLASQAAESPAALHVSLNLSSTRNPAPVRNPIFDSNFLASEPSLNPLPARSVTVSAPLLELRTTPIPDSGDGTVFLSEVPFEPESPPTLPATGPSSFLPAPAAGPGSIPFPEPSLSAFPFTDAPEHAVNPFNPSQPVNSASSPTPPPLPKHVSSPFHLATVSEPLPPPHCPKAPAAAEPVSFFAPVRPPASASPSPLSGPSGPLPASEKASTNPPLPSSSPFQSVPPPGSDPEKVKPLPASLPPLSPPGGESAPVPLLKNTPPVAAMVPPPGFFPASPSRRPASADQSPPAASPAQQTPASLPRTAPALPPISAPAQSLPLADVVEILQKGRQTMDAAFQGMIEQLQASLNTVAVPPPAPPAAPSPPVLKTAAPEPEAVEVSFPNPDTAKVAPTVSPFTQPVPAGPCGSALPSPFPSAPAVPVSPSFPQYPPLHPVKPASAAISLPPVNGATAGSSGPVALPSPFPFTPTPASAVMEQEPPADERPTAPVPPPAASPRRRPMPVRNPELLANLDSTLAQAFNPAPESATDLPPLPSAESTIPGNAPIAPEKTSAAAPASPLPPPFPLAPLAVPPGNAFTPVPAAPGPDFTPPPTPPGGSEPPAVPAPFSFLQPAAAEKLSGWEDDDDSPESSPDAPPMWTRTRGRSSLS